MKANELMIGDWVYNPFTRKTLRLTFGRDLDLVEELCLEPIPLTGKILENNGFEKQQSGNFTYENDDVNLRIEFYPKNMNYTRGCYDYIDIERGCVTITEMPVEFIHELQHALWLCGVDKTIEL